MDWDVVLGHCCSWRVQDDLADNDNQHPGTKGDSQCRSHTQQSQNTVGVAIFIIVSSVKRITKHA